MSFSGLFLLRLATAADGHDGGDGHHDLISDSVQGGPRLRRRSRHRRRRRRRRRDYVISMVSAAFDAVRKDDRLIAPSIRYSPPLGPISLSLSLSLAHGGRDPGICGLFFVRNAGKNSRL
ncbi:hypothetical protein LX32DRAFT_304357 [Colletotrichum zoysiae]|uniref:Uncharacterized protein n=1 Tax=Colletotrichum zoysiae TaxID=1216348 RepID=A0AAD9H205_9PEZI|nr:hypothetical protein LX32DRAFT_304357 [Colletotrichum zoysiae]